MDSTLPNNAVVTVDDRGPILAILTWFFMTMMTLSVIIKLAIKLFIRGSLAIDDYTVIAALVFSLGQCVAISLAIAPGICRRDSTLSPENVISIEKAQYAANLLYILGIGLAKISVLQLLGHLAVSGPLLKLTKMSVYVSIVWIVTSFLALVFSCGVHQPWNSGSGQCINEFAFWIGISPIDILTELVVIVTPILMMQPVQVSFDKKVVVVTAFIFRVAVIILTITRLALLKSYFSSSEPIFDFLTSGIITQALLSTSITTACIPALKPFLDGFDSGMLGVGFKGTRAQFGGNSYEMQSSGLDKAITISESNNRETNGNGYMAAIASTSQAADNETGSLESGKSDQMIIKRTDHWTVRYENVTPSLEPKNEVEDAI